MVSCADGVRLCARLHVQERNGGHLNCSLLLYSTVPNLIQHRLLIYRTTATEKASGPGIAVVQSRLQCDQPLKQRLSLQASVCITTVCLHSSSVLHSSTKFQDEARALCHLGSLMQTLSSFQCRKRSAQCVDSTVPGCSMEAVGPLWSTVLCNAGCNPLITELENNVHQPVSRVHRKMGMACLGPGPVGL